MGEPRRGLLILPLLQAQTHSGGCGTDCDIACTSDVCPKEGFSMSLCTIWLIKSSQLIGVDQSVKCYEVEEIEEDGKTLTCGTLRRNDRRD